MTRSIWREEGNVRLEKHQQDHEDVDINASGNTPHEIYMTNAGKLR